ncbi:MAG: FG-GAP-like repeat-containing protein, partial [Pirellulaceae bacterium]|nr:FG-GAP-like repeat-containing protein [Pirellulaceae bacterium]
MPTANSHAAAASTNISAAYDQNLNNGGSVTDTTFVVHAMFTGQVVDPPHASAISVDSNLIIFNPDNAFQPGETIQVIATDGIQNTHTEPAQQRVWDLRIATSGGSALFVDSGQILDDHGSFGVSLGDLDGDGYLDAFVANYDEGHRVWINNGADPNLPRFVNNGQILGDNLSEGMALGDLDGDGDLDAFVANFFSEGNRVWMNDGAGTFTDSGQILGNHDSNNVELGDLDGDGDLDAIVANNGANHVWINGGAGNFANSGQNLGNHNSSGLAIGDLDRDGDVDTLVSNRNGPNRVWLNDGAGNFTDSGQALGNHNSYAVGLGDLDGDADLDAFAVNSTGNRVWMNDGAGNFVDSGQELGDHSSAGIALGDLDGDGDLDAFVA